MATLATLATLKLSTAVKPAHMPVVQVRRNKLVQRLWEQMELARAQAAGTQFAPSIKALDFSKPQDVYNKMPSLMTLLPVPSDLTNKKYSASFLSAVEHVRHQPKFSSVAYSHAEDYRTAWHFFTGRPTQEIADEAALRMCESTRLNSRPSAPNCVVYKRVENISKAAVVDVNSGVGFKKPTENDVALKLEKLKDLYSKGLINKDQYDSQVKEELGKL